MIKITVVPSGAGRFRAETDTGEMFPPSTTPFFAAARRLLDRGVSPVTVMVMFHHLNPDTECLRATVGAAAALTVKEGDRQPRFVKWQEFPGMEGGAPCPGPLQDVAE